MIVESFLENSTFWVFEKWVKKSPGMQLPVEKKRKQKEKIIFKGTNAERSIRNATGHETHHGTLETVEVYHALRCIVSMY